MAKKRSKRNDSRGRPARRLLKTPSGIRGLDELTGGGLPAGRTTLICGGPGCGKTLLGMEFLVRGAVDHDQHGVFMTFEESAAELADNMISLGFDLDDLTARRRLLLLEVRFDPDPTGAVGGYGLDGLFIRLGHAIDAIGAKRVVLDTVEALFSRLPEPQLLRGELQRLFGWLKDRGVTTVVTGERGDGPFTRQGLEEYVSDCVILLDHRVDSQVSTRRLRIVKYRGALHGTNEYPFLIGEDGIVVLPLTTLGLEHHVGDERISSGVEELDQMLAGGGFYRGSTILVSGTAGTGKTTLASHFAEAACRRGERVLYFALEESADQLQRNQRSVGIRLAPHLRRGRLRIHATRATRYGLESHLALLLKALQDFAPQVVVIDPITSFLAGAEPADVRAMLIRLIDALKTRQITGFLTCLTDGGVSGYRGLEMTETGVSSLVDSWLLLRDIELGGERNRGLYVLKSRGMSHSNQIREFLITDQGVRLATPYLGAEGVLTGSMRVARSARERAEALKQEHEYQRRRRAAEQRLNELNGRLQAQQAEIELQRLALSQLDDEERARRAASAALRQALSDSRAVAGPRRAGLSPGRRSARKSGS